MSDDCSDAGDCGNLDFGPHNLWTGDAGSEVGSSVPKFLQVTLNGAAVIEQSHEFVIGVSDMEHRSHWRPQKHQAR